MTQLNNKIITPNIYFKSSNLLATQFRSQSILRLNNTTAQFNLTYFLNLIIFPDIKLYPENNESVTNTLSSNHV